MKRSADKGTKYDQLLVSVFKKKWKPSLAEVPFSKDEFIDAANALGLRIKNLADVIYTYRSRRPMPKEIRRTGNWVIASRGSGLYAFAKVAGETTVTIPESLKVYPIPYAVPEIVAQNLARDEQGLLTIVRYNRILDVFTGLACFHLQSHIRTQLPGHGQVEIDDLYVGIDKDGQGFVLPVEAKEENERLGLDKAVALTLFARARFPRLICRPIAVLRRGLHAFDCVEFEPAEELSKVVVLEMRRYQLVVEE
ncbi:MAG: hypothetical protein ABSA12_08145 [Verrucomicrobiia bacterium]